MQLYQEKQRVALVSLFASAVLAAIKFIAALLSGSLGLFSEALHSLVDFGATAVTLMAIRYSDHPADSDHHYGHAKIESVAALAEAAMLLGITGWLVFEAINRLTTGHSDVVLSWWLFAVLALSIAVDWQRSRALSEVAKKTSSEALAADALHFRSDMLSSAAVIVGLALTAMGYPLADPIAALIVAGVIAVAALRLGKKTLDALLDAAPQSATNEVMRLTQAQKSVLAVKQLRLRPAGPNLFVELAVAVPRTLPLTEMEAVRLKLEDEIKQAIPLADITVQTLPVELDSETAFEKVSFIAAAQRASIHHLTVQDLGHKLAVSFDLEVDGKTSLAKAHAQATELEEAIRQGLGVEVEVESHIEPLPLRMLQGEAASQRTAKDIELTLRRCAKIERGLRDIHSVRVRNTDQGIYVHYHCRFKPEMTIDAVHNAVDRVENALKKSRSKIARVVAHAEPLGHERHKL